MPLETYSPVQPDPAHHHDHQVKWGKVMDQGKCIGCHACTVACKAEHEVALGVTRTYVKQVEVGQYPNVRRQFQVTRCNQCDNAPCVEICPVTALYYRPDGIVDFDRDACIGCKACIAACPYDAIFIDPVTHSAEKCNFCAHRIDQGLEPACVSVCPERAIIVGDLNDPSGEIMQYLGREKLDVRRPEKGTNPKVFYNNASEYTLSPTAAAYGSSHMWSAQQEGYTALPGADNPVLELLAQSSAGQKAARALVAYDVAHSGPWGGLVSLYTWTKSIAAGVYLVAAVSLLLGGTLSLGAGIGVFAAAGLFLALTGVVLVADLKHPARFLRILTRPQWKSWLVKGAYAIAGYGTVLLISGIAHLLGAGAVVRGLAWVGIPLAALTAAYTAWLFAQARGRDLWQNPLLPLHLLTQAVLAGAAVLALLGQVMALPANLGAMLPGILMGAAAVHVLMGLSEAVIPHPTRDGARAAHALVAGPFKSFYLTGITLGGLVPLALIATGPALLPLAAVLTLIGLLAYEHGYVQAGQAVPQA